MRIHPIDLLIVASYLAGVTLFGWRFRGGAKTMTAYFLGGRSAPWWALAVSIVATETSALTLIGTPAIAFASNLAFLQLAIGYVVARAALCVFLVPQYFRGEFFTAYQLLERRFGARSRRFTAALFLVTRALAEGVRIAAVGKVISVIFGFGATFSIILVTGLALFYTFEGGMRAVIWTDLLQFLLCATGSVVAFYVAIHAVAGGWAGVAAAASAATGGSKLTIFDFTFSLTRSYTFWSGIIGGTFLTMASHGTDQTMVQRLLAARNERDAKKGLLASGFLVFAQFALFLLLGVALFAYSIHAAQPLATGGDYDRVFPEFIVRVLPTGIRGFVLAGIFAVAMANASGSLNSLASSAIMDFRRRGAISAGSDAELGSRMVNRSRMLTLGWGGVLGVLGLVRWGPVLQAGLTIASIAYGPMLGVFLLGIATRGATESGALAGMITGLAAMLVIHHWTPLAWTWYVLAGTLITFAAGMAASRLNLILPPSAGARQTP
jgi:solute:Na+ symporter, SSS family